MSYTKLITLNLKKTLCYTKIITLNLKKKKKKSNKLQILDDGGTALQNGGVDRQHSHPQCLNSDTEPTRGSSVPK